MVEESLVAALYADVTVLLAEHEGTLQRTVIELDRVRGDPLVVER